MSSLRVASSKTAYAEKTSNADSPGIEKEMVSFISKVLISCWHLSSPGWLLTWLRSLNKQSLNPDPKVTELPFELTALVMPYSLAKESTDLDLFYRIKRKSRDRI